MEKIEIKSDIQVKQPIFCGKCGKLVYQPFDENLYIIKEENMFYKVCRHCWHSTEVK